MEIFMSGYIALGETLELINANEERLLGRFSARFLDKSKARIQEELKSAESFDFPQTAEVFPVRGSILDALWEWGEAHDTGFRINLLKIPILQETIEICEELDMDPYFRSCDNAAYIISDGFKIPCGDVFVSQAAPDMGGIIRIGHTTTERARILELRDFERYLYAPS